jgi:two-component sensor histidine kinase
MFSSNRVHAVVVGAHRSALILASPSEDGQAGGGSRPGAGGPAGVILRLEPDVEAAGKAREALEQLEEHIEEGVLQDMHLLVTELVTNSVRHADAAADEPVHVEVSVGGDRVFVAVEDGGRGFEPSPRSADSPRDAGWGLHLVERLSSRWGVTGDGRTRVWLELARDGRAEAA